MEKKFSLKEKHIVLLYESYIGVKKVFKISICNDFIIFLTNFIDFIQFLSILYNFNNTILQKTLFSQKKGPCGKIHTRQNIFRHFSPKKRPLRENSHTAKYFQAFFSEKKAPAGKCRHGKKRFTHFFNFSPGEKFLCITNVHI